MILFLLKMLKKVLISSLPLKSDPYRPYWPFAEVALYDQCLSCTGGVGQNWTQYSRCGPRSA